MLRASRTTLISVALVSILAVTPPAMAATHRPVIPNGMAGSWKHAQSLRNKLQDPSFASRVAAATHLPPGQPSDLVARDTRTAIEDLRTTVIRARTLLQPLSHPERIVNVQAHPELARRPASREVKHAATAAANAARMIAEALDRDLPTLTAARAPRIPARVDGCDVLDATPALCVGSAADNVYTKDAALLIDLGGNDRYENSAGGARISGDPAGLPVSVNVDLAGDDTYVASHAVSNEGFYGNFTVAQGASYGGVGILVDLLGDDHYIARSPGGARSTVVAQGASTFAGFGGLFDLGGSDVFSSFGNGGAPEGTTAYVRAQGAGADAGVGLLVDAGGAQDVYDVAVQPIEQACWPCGAPPGDGEAVTGATQRYIIAQGAAGAGSGTLFDDGGDNHYVLSARSEWDLPTNATLTWNSRYSFAPAINVYAQGSSLGSDGTLISGTGNDSYAAAFTGTGGLHAIIAVQGAAWEGTGTLLDNGGDDRYSLEASWAVEARAGSTPCVAACDGSVTFDVRRALTSYLIAQGSGYFPGTGALLDAAGADVYRADARTTVTADMTADPDVKSLRAFGRTPFMLVQGSGAFFASGYLLDAGPGADSFDASVDGTVTTAFASSMNPAAVVAAVVAGSLLAQGAAGSNDTGQLVDVAGDGATFAAKETLHARSIPSGGRSLTTYNGSWPLLQGSGNGLLVSGGANSRLWAVPSRPVCPASGPRGSGFWLECGATEATRPNGAGFAGPSSAQTPILWLTRAPTHARRDKGPQQIDARLADPAGAPLEGRTLVVELQEAGDAAWTSLWSVSTETQTDGSLSVDLPVEVPAEDFVQRETNHGVAPDHPFRVVISFGGDRTFYPAMVVSPIILTSSE